MTTPRDPQPLSVLVVGGPTAVLELGGLRLITDPTFDAPQDYEPRPGVHMTKTAGPAVAVEDVGALDVALVSHDHHMDNLDVSGRALLSRIPRVLTTVSGAQRLGGGATPLANWDHVDVPRPGGGSLRVTGVPAQHGPDGSEHLVGEVTGFVLSADDLPTVYVSGDNQSLDVVRAIADRIDAIDVAVLFAGGAQMPYLGDAYLTLNSQHAAEAVKVLGAAQVVSVHLDGWAHFTDGAQSLRDAFAEHGLQDRLALGEPGSRLTLAA